MNTTLHSNSISKLSNFAFVFKNYIFIVIPKTYVIMFVFTNVNQITQITRNKMFACIVKSVIYTNDFEF